MDDLGPDDPRRRPGGFQAHGNTHVPTGDPLARAYDRYGNHQNDTRHDSQTAMAGFPQTLFASGQPQTGHSSPSRPITLQELEQMSRAQSGGVSQSMSSQFAGNSLFGGPDGSVGVRGVGHGHAYPSHGQPVQHSHLPPHHLRGGNAMGGNAMGGFVDRQQEQRQQLGGGQQQSLFGDSFFQGMASMGNVQGGIPMMGVDSMGRMNGHGVSSGDRGLGGTQPVRGAPHGHPGNAHVQTPPRQAIPSQQFSSHQQQALQMEQLSALFGQQTVGDTQAIGMSATGVTGMTTGTTGTRGSPPINHVDPLSAAFCGSVHVGDSNRSSFSVPNMPSIPPISPVSPISPLTMTATTVESTQHDARHGRADNKESTQESVSTPVSSQQYQKQSREDRWVDIMDHTHTGRQPVTDMAALNASLLRLAQSLSPKDDDVNSWKQALAYVQDILKKTLGSSLKDVSLFGSSANGLAVHGNNDIDVSAMVDLGDEPPHADGFIGLHEEEIEAREAAIHQKKANIIEELGLALQRDLEARFMNGTNGTNGASPSDGNDRTDGAHAINGKNSRNSKSAKNDSSDNKESPFNLLVLPNARVPVIKFTYPPTKTQVDITINNKLACLNTKLIACYAALDERVGQLVHIVKHWAKRRHVNDPYTGTLSSYCYVLMCIFHCQTRNPPILPNLQDERMYPMTVDTVVDSWKVAYLDDVRLAKRAFTTQNTQSLASLVWEFFEFWAWKHSYPHDVISIRSGRVISKASKDWTKRIGRDRHLVCIEDPFVLSHDLGRTVDMRSKDVIRKEFFRAGTVLRDYDTCFDLLFEPYSSEARQRTPKRGGRGGRDRERERRPRGH